MLFNNITLTFIIDSFYTIYKKLTSACLWPQNSKSDLWVGLWPMDILTCRYTNIQEILNIKLECQFVSRQISCTTLIINIRQSHGDTCRNLYIILIVTISKLLLQIEKRKKKMQEKREIYQSFYFCWLWPSCAPIIFLCLSYGKRKLLTINRVGWKDGLNL